MTTITLLSLLLLIGACGKSAATVDELAAGCYGWPTPVSALTCSDHGYRRGLSVVAACSPWFLSSTAMAAIALRYRYRLVAHLRSGAKRNQTVLAYSTMSQVGYVSGGRVGQRLGGDVSSDHPCLFQGVTLMAAGCVINLAGHENDIRRMWVVCASALPWCSGCLLPDSGARLGHH